MPEDTNVVVATEDPVGVGAPPAWRVVGAAAAYGADGAAPLLAIRCDRAAGMLVLERGGGGQALTLAAGDVEQTLPVEAGEKDKVQARVPLGDPLLARMAAPQSRMFLVTANGERIALPGGVAVRRVLDACRSPQPAAAPDPAGAADPANVAAPAVAPSVAVPPPAQP